jgi:hypothetical protein
VCSEEKFLCAASFATEANLYAAAEHRKTFFLAPFGAESSADSNASPESRPESWRDAHSMKVFFSVCFLLSGSLLAAARGQESSTFSCPAGKADVLKYFVMSKARRGQHFLAGSTNSVYTQVFPDEEFAPQGYWFWIKSPKAHGFDVKAFDRERVYMRATELIWTDNSTFKRFTRDLPIAERCVPEGQPGAEIRVADTRFDYYSSCKVYKSSTLGTAINTLDAPALMNVGGNVGKVWTRVLHYRYNCDKNFQKCDDEEQFYLANGFGLWRWKHFRDGALRKDTLMNDLEPGQPAGDLACPESYR